MVTCSTKIPMSSMDLLLFKAPDIRHPLGNPSIAVDCFITSRNKLMRAAQRPPKKDLGANSYSLELYAPAPSHRNTIKRFSFPSDRIALAATPDTPFQTTKEASRTLSTTLLNLLFRSHPTGTAM